MATLKEETESELKRVIDEFIKGVKLKGVPIKVTHCRVVPSSLKTMVIAHLDALENHKLYWQAKSILAIIKRSSVPGAQDCVEEFSGGDVQR